MSTTPDQPENVTHRGVEAIARRLGVSRTTLLRWPRDRWEFSVIRQDPSGRWLMEEDDYRAALRRHTETSS